MFVNVVVVLDEPSVTGEVEAPVVTQSGCQLLPEDATLRAASFPRHLLTKRRPIGSLSPSEEDRADASYEQLEAGGGARSRATPVRPMPETSDRAATRVQQHRPYLRVRDH